MNLLSFSESSFCWGEGFVLRLVKNGYVEQAQVKPVLLGNEHHTGARVFIMHYEQLRSICLAYILIYYLILDSRF